jgi:GNAT superfamily N-acetyltransferase
MMDDIRIERARTDQAETAYAIVCEYYEALDVVARETLGEFRREYFGRARGFWLAWVASSLAGSIALRELFPGDAAEIKRMYVREAYRGQGIAQRLLREAESFARESGYRRIVLDSADSMRAARRLYERNGYEPCERYNRNPQATVFMSKHLLAS